MPDHTHGGPSRTRGMGTARRPAVTAAIAGAAILAAAVLLWQHAQPKPNVGAAAVTALSRTGDPPTTVTGRPAPIPIRSATLPAAVVVDRPVHVRVERLGISATVIPVGVDADGDVVIPSDVDTVGWYRFGPGLGEPGSIVITGHVDNAAQGDGAFARLRDANPGDLIHVTGGNGAETIFRVVSREEYPKSTIKLGRYFSVTGSPRLTLITCGGPFNSGTGHYRDNVIVTAVPGSPSQG